MRWLGICMLSLVSFWGCSSIRLAVGQSELVKVCSRYVDDDGYLRGREAEFNRAGARLLLRNSPFSLRGLCPPNAQGEPRRVKVCLVQSSKCFNDRTTTIWEERKEWWFKKYPNSYAGTCKSGTEEKDTCGTSHLFKVSERFKIGCLQYDKVCQAEKK